MKLFQILITIGAIFGWEEAEMSPMYGSVDNFKTCESDSDCTDDHVCIQMMWSYWLEYDSGKGCFSKAVCQGNGAWDHIWETYDDGT